MLKFQDYSELVHGQSCLRHWRTYLLSGPEDAKMVLTGCGNSTENSAIIETLLSGRLRRSLFLLSCVLWAKPLLHRAILAAPQGNLTSATGSRERVLYPADREPSQPLSRLRASGLQATCCWVALALILNHLDLRTRFWRSKFEHSVRVPSVYSVSHSVQIRL